MRKHTIKDIAKLAGVSKGTVDRVLHNRGKVSQKALESVNKVLSEIDYKPNIIARSLKNNKIHKICILLPDPNLDSYWLPCVEGINEAITEFSSFNVDIEIFYFNPTSITSFIKTNDILLETSPDAVLLVPLFYKESLDIIDNYNSLGILSGTFNNQIKSRIINSFVGQDLFQSGRVAASLIDLFLNEGLIAIVHIDEEYENALHMQEKEKGFRNYFSESKNQNFDIKTLKLKSDNVDESFSDFLKNSPDLKGVFVTTSKSYQIAEIISKNKNTDVAFVGYDLLEQNISYLQDKTIKFLIHQNPKKQANIGVTLLVEHLIFDKKITEEVLLPLYIINGENVKDYLN
ncbi:MULTISPECIES: LacI family DNA-binding transcriptional regulator [unclassified Cellulophaga]|uniref:LacI family DNA-binding transcriptional regulator n=1 Tax=unclassified Cellulophaga TaxID=2634405 RepID=UPI000C2C9921|nr:MULTISPECIES: LacI family DNA-binding transcriptional regulator [unclassified Cellulophaga]MDO6492233.1 LacI family DNA-binding transcriptional regulator [Cellulophaga sp. 2_MG-2023]MDO6493183.1 LacI family DNA-binding transcriptional regulator [Cellulophaga sp. 3_MG-2023]PKB44827.1 LacI family transcriptional regulator [Cellulophaga sp. RHA19]